MSNLKVMSRNNTETGTFKKKLTLLAAGSLAVSITLAAVPAFADIGVGVSLGVSVGGGAVGGVVNSVTNTVDHTVDHVVGTVDHTVDHVVGTVDNVVGGGTDGGIIDASVNVGINNGNNNGINGGSGGLPGVFAARCESLGLSTFNSFGAVDKSQVPLGQIQGVVMSENNITSARFLTSSVVFGKQRCITITGEQIQVVGSNIVLPITQTDLFRQLGN